MRPIGTVSTQILSWNQPKAMTRYWELLAGSETVATLKMEKTCGSLATASSADGQWTFKRSGFLHVRVHIRRAGSEQDVAIFYPRWTGSGILEETGKGRLPWFCKGFFDAQWGWLTDAGAEILTMNSASSFLKHMADVHIAPDSAIRPDLSLIILFGFYLTVLMTEDAAAAGTAVIIS